MNTDYIFTIASIGIVAAILNIILTKAGREDIANITTWAGLIIALYIVVQLMSDLLIKVKNVFGLQ